MSKKMKKQGEIKQALCRSTNVPQQVLQVFLFGDNNDK